MELTLKRAFSGTVGVIGHLFCEQKQISDTLENLNYIIPAGRYKVVKHFSGHFKAVRPMLVDVPGRKYILFHEGNFASDSKGCILLGDYLTKNCFAHSKAKLAEVMKIMDVAWGRGEEVFVSVNSL